MRALIDTCVIIDALQNRIPFDEDARKIFRALAKEQFTGYITAKEAADIFYLTHRFTHDNDQTRTIMSKLLAVFDLLDTAADDCRNALFSQVTDFEDAMMIETALREKIDCIVTRNIRDYKDSSIEVFTPQQFLCHIQ